MANSLSLAALGWLGAEAAVIGVCDTQAQN
jgi:hypothetical protein